MRPINKTPWRQLLIFDNNCYGAARSFLLTTTGYYCAYCEVPLGVDMPVEHKAPKGGTDAPDEKCFPDMATRYCNFILACSACNSVKNAHPNKDDSVVFLKAEIKDKKSYTNDELLYGALFSMVWPDTITQYNTCPPVPQLLNNLYTGKDETYKLFAYNKEMKSQANLSADGILKLALADANKPWATTAQNEVWVTPNETYITGKMDEDQLRMRVKNTLKTLNLNYYNSSDPKASDRRVKDRTAAWDVAVSALGQMSTTVTEFSLMDTINLDQFNAESYMVIQMIREMALSTGHWSVWMAVFAKILNRDAAPWNDLVKVPLGKEVVLLNALFVQYQPWEKQKRIYSTQIDPPTVFLGTDISRVTLP